MNHEWCKVMIALHGLVCPVVFARRRKRECLPRIKMMKMMDDVSSVVTRSSKRTGA